MKTLVYNSEGFLVEPIECNEETAPHRIEDAIKIFSKRFVTELYICEENIGKEIALVIDIKAKYLKENSQGVKRLLEKYEIFSIKAFGDSLDSSKEYAACSGKVARALNVSFEVVLAIGPSKAILISELSERVLELRGIMHALSNCGIVRRKRAIKELLSKDLYEDLEIGKMGQMNSTRVADFLKEAILAEEGETTVPPRPDSHKRVRKVVEKYDR